MVRYGGGINSLGLSCMDRMGSLRGSARRFERGYRIHPQEGAVMECKPF